MNSNSDRWNDVVLFDGECIFCNKAVLFLLRHDKDGKLYFGGLQSAAGREILQTNNLSSGDFNTIIYVTGGNVYRESSAVLRLLGGLGGVFWPAYGLLAVPAFIRDPMYRLFSKWRYRLFGRLEACSVPPEGVRDRFI